MLNHRKVSVNDLGCCQDDLGALDAIPEDSDSLTSDGSDEELLIDFFDETEAELDEPVPDDPEDWRGFSCCMAAGFSSEK